MSLDFTLGKMEECTMDSTKMTRSMDMEFTLGLTRKNTQVGGILENNMD